MTKKVFTTPLKEEDMRSLKIGDVIYITGDILHVDGAART